MRGKNATYVVMMVVGGGGGGGWYVLPGPVSQEILNSLQPREKAAMWGVNTKEIYMEIELSSHRREMLLFLTTNMAGMTSHANHQCKMSDKDFF